VVAVGLYVRDVEHLRRVAESICKKHGTMCYSSGDPDDLVLFGFTWVESFYYVDPLDCTSDLKCVEEVFRMHGEVFKLARMSIYEVLVDEELLEKAIEKLLLLRTRVGEETGRV
jgi:hypothetical protein